MRLSPSATGSSRESTSRKATRSRRANCSASFRTPESRARSRTRSALRFRPSGSLVPIHERKGRPMPDKAIITCALTGVLTDPRQHPVPVTPEEMAREARRAFDAGACVMHVHFRRQGQGEGHLPSWEPKVAVAIMQAIRDACPGVVLNQSTGTRGPDIQGPLDCLRAVKPELAACNAGSLNYLKVRSDGSWAWPPRLFDNPVDKVKAYLEVMAQTGTQPEFECFDTGMDASRSGSAADPAQARDQGRALAGHRDRAR